MGVSSISDGLRTTSSSAFLNLSELPNLTVWTNSRVIKILLDEKRTVGVETLDGRTGESILYSYHSCFEDIDSVVSVDKVRSRSMCWLHRYA